MKNQADKIDQALQRQLVDLSATDAPSWGDFEARRSGVSGVSARGDVIRARSGGVRRFAVWGSVAAAVLVGLLLGDLVLWGDRGAVVRGFDLAVPIEVALGDRGAASKAERVVESGARRSNKLVLNYSQVTEEQAVVVEQLKNEKSSIQALDNSNISGVVEPVLAANSTPATPRSGGSSDRYIEPAEWQQPQRGAVPAKRRGPSISAGLYANLGTGTNSSNASPYVLTKSMEYRVGQFVNEVNFFEDEIDHQFPVSVGAMVRVNLIPRLNIETGLMYSYLKSTAEKGAELRQKYSHETHYLGIPVAVSYDFVTNRRLDFYATAGTMVEYAVYDRVDLNVYAKDGSEVSSRWRESALDGLLVSFNAGLGLNVHLTPVVGLYVEPGVSAYLPNDNHSVNFRTQSPVQFNLRAGVKFRIK